MADTEVARQAELNTFRELLPTLGGSEGRFALIANGDLLGIFDTYADALQTGYAQRGLEPFLVKQISTVEAVANFSRAVGVA